MRIQPPRKATVERKFSTAGAMCELHRLCRSSNFSAAECGGSGSGWQCIHTAQLLYRTNRYSWRRGRRWHGRRLLSRHHLLGRRGQLHGAEDISEVICACTTLRLRYWLLIFMRCLQRRLATQPPPRLCHWLGANSVAFGPQRRRRAQGFSTAAFSAHIVHTWIVPGVRIRRRRGLRGTARWRRGLLLLSRAQVVTTKRSSRVDTLSCL